ncbi:M23 family metallopeptidase [Pseudanabaena sp. FACHB-2040]|nr:M23 family metallopeptidase [Pseudanabaena sp. FACHB-2040]MBD2257105.1 M23 family metallopeptidase [Pseudanabaena sp. FACHB-2040]
MSRHTPSQRTASVSVPLFWVRLLALFGGLGLTGSSLAISEAPVIAEIEGPIYTTAEQLLPSQKATAAPAASHGSQAVQAAPAPVPAFSPLRTSPTASLTTKANSDQRQPAPAPISLIAQQLIEIAPEGEPAVAPAAPAAPAASEAPAAAPEAPSLAVPSEISAEADVPAGYNSVFIDPTDYSVGATESPSLVFSERSTGCQITVPAGQALAQSCGGGSAPAAAPTSSAQTAAAAAANSGGLQVGPVNFSSRGVSLGNTTIVSREALNEKLRPLNVLRRGTQEYIFPLSIPAPITSLFGWRMHPIFGEWRFHAGTDIAAPSGTPVMATRAGQVSVSDFLGGYGLTVILRHEGELESRYAHLSQILVQPGERVEQGEVIGLVGSTGNSTGPHLHFEMRQLTTQGWIAVDPQEILEYGVANLINIINNPLQALNRPVAAPEAAAPQVLPGDLPYRPAQPNAS